MSDFDEELKWSCRFCGHKLRTNREHAGKQTRCPRCRKWLWIPLHGLTVDELIEKLTKAPEATTRAGAAGELSRLGLKAKQAVAHLIKAGQRDGSALVRFRSLDAVARIVDGEKWPGQIPARIITEIINAVKSSHGDARNDIDEFGSHPANAIRQKAQHALVRIGAAAEQLVAEAIQQCEDDQDAHDILADALKAIREHQDD